MGVLNVAKSGGGPSGAASSEPSGGGVPESDASAERSVDIASEFTRWLEDFLTGLVPMNYRIKLNWDLLSPIFSVLSGLGTVAGAIGVFAS